MDESTVGRSHNSVVLVAVNSLILGKPQIANVWAHHVSSWSHGDKFEMLGRFLRWRMMSKVIGSLEAIVLRQGVRTRVVSRERWEIPMTAYRVIVPDGRDVNRR